MIIYCIWKRNQHLLLLKWLSLSLFLLSECLLFCVSSLKISSRWTSLNLVRPLLFWLRNEWSLSTIWEMLMSINDCHEIVYWYLICLPVGELIRKMSVHGISLHELIKFYRFHLILNDIPIPFLFLSDQISLSFGAEIDCIILPEK